MDFGGRSMPSTLVIEKGTRPLLCLLLALCCWSSGSLAFPQSPSLPNNRRVRQIIFEGQLNRTRNNPTHSCRIENGEVFVPSRSRCYPLLEQGPCANGDLVHLDLQTGQGWCRPDPCAVPNCGTSPCPDTFVKVPLVTGEIFCDCTLGSIFWPQHSKCYGAYTRGPCKHNQVIATDPSGRALCRPRMCPVGQVLIHDKCYAKGTKGPCQNASKVGLDVHTHEPECLDIAPHFLITSPNLPRSVRSSCAPGSRMNHANLCLNSFPTRGMSKLPKICPPGFQSYFHRCIRRV
ncbi:uncharacterized protein LOC143033000 [Oratosquilla oratoria]|uniref:uncharacterized protein LOC143033000 n=1 Tax=Oratosquilla oratoria TaxID=337810 RepID=UPI003F75B7D9